MFSLEAVGNVTSLIVYLYPLRVMKEIREKTKTDENYAPYMATLTCTVLWAIQAAMHGQTLRLITNCVGAVMYVVYVMVVLFGQKRTKRFQFIKMEHLGLKILLMQMYTVGAFRIAMYADEDNNSMNTLCFPFAMVKVTYTLVPAVTAYRSKNVALIPLSLSVLLIIQGLIWSIHGFIENDLYTVIPNIFGVLIAVGQAALHALITKHNNINNN